MTVNLARLGTSAATPSDRAALTALTERARAAGDSIHPDDVIAGAARYAGPIEAHTPGQALTVEHIYSCDWCDTPATVVIDHGQDFACSFHFGYHFGPAMAAGETFRVVPAPRR